MDKDKILNLSRLARIEISENEAEILATEFEDILGYVGEVSKATLEHTAHSTPILTIKNVVREDSNPHSAGLYKEDILNQAPSRQGDYIKVKKIL